MSMGFCCHNLAILLGKVRKLVLLCSASLCLYINAAIRPISLHLAFASGCGAAHVACIRFLHCMHVLRCFQGAVFGELKIFRMSQPNIPGRHIY